MMLVTEPYAAQVARWPRAGRHILAQFTDDAVVVYQVYRPAIGLFAARHKFFGGAFSLNRRSWIKPNFLWMMYRSGWGTREGQEVTLAIWLERAAFIDSLALLPTVIGVAQRPTGSGVAPSRWTRDPHMSAVSR